MNQNLHSPTKLTEFARDFEDEPETLFGRFVNKIQNAYNQSYNTVNELPSSGTQVLPAGAKSVFYAESISTAGDESRESSVSSVSGASVARPQPPNTLRVERGTSSSSTNTSSSTRTAASSERAALAGAAMDDAPQLEEVVEGRTMVNVLKRISNIVATKNSDLRNYKDTDLQRFWMPDAKAKECYDCSQKFSTFRRKHHCRLCGQIFCSKCCNQVVPGKIIMCSGDLKVCNYCSKIVLSYLKSPNITVDLHSDLQALQQDLTSKLEVAGDASDKSHTLPMRTPLTRKVSVGYQEERFATHAPNSLSLDDRKNILQQSNSLIALHEQMQRTLSPQNCGTALIEFLNNNNKSSNKVQAVAILSAMLAAGFLQPIVPDSEQCDFDENLHYRFVELPRQNSDALSLRGIPLHSDADSGSLTATSPIQFDANCSEEPQLPPKSIDPVRSFHSSSSSREEELEVENAMRSTSTTSKLIESYCEHEDQLLAQLLRTFRLDARWAKVLLPICCRAANHFKPEYCTADLMDIRSYVNFKKVPGGRRQECTIVGGVVFSKNVAHKDMATRVERPRILLLQCPIVYERIEGKFVSLATVLLQEKEYLRNVCARIMNFKPNVLLVHKNVAGVAQDMLRSQGITLVLDVKLSVMERLARTLQCDILTSIESNIAPPKLGVCDAFYIRSYDDGNGTSKTLMFFEKLTNPRGFTCLLRGGTTNNELAKVKKVAAFLVYARYNWRLEMSFLLDEFAEPLAPKPPIFDSKEPSPEDDDKKDTEDAPQMRWAALPPAAAPLSLKRVPAERKSEDKFQSAITENVADFTDPLRSADSSNAAGDYAPVALKLAVELRYDNRFRNALSSTLLSISPFLTFPLPYLETEQGRKCALRALFPAELYFSKLWSSAAQQQTVSTTSGSLERQESAELISAETELTQLKPPHAFLKLKITAPIDNREIQTLLAEFRAYGGRYPKKKKMFRFVRRRRESYQRPQKLSDDHVYKDALDLENHQRLPVLFCSFYFDPKSASSFCAPPTLLDMKFYGQQDIMLGQFLQRYCCRLSSICTLCNLPMLGHVRRYVHNMGCVQVFLSEDHTRTDPNRIYFTAWCSICHEVTPSVPLSEAAKCLSFAKYLELRFHGHAYRKRELNETPAGGSSACRHSLHRDYIHYFSFGGVGAKFKYTPIDVWEIGLPALVLTLPAPRAFDHFAILEEIKNFSLKGHEVYTRIHERIADLATEDEASPLVADLKTTLSKDQFIFKQHVEIIQTLLTDTRATSHDVSDGMLMAKRVLAESIELWGPRLHDIAVAQKLAIKQAAAHQQHAPSTAAPHEVGAQHADAGRICTEDLRPEYSDCSPTAQEAPAITAAIGAGDNAPQTDDANEEPPEVPPSVAGGGHVGVEKKSSVEQLLATAADKKSIKKMLIHLLPSTGHANLLQSPFVAHEHYTLPLGTFPILVRDQDFSSVIAYSLTSADYQRAVAELVQTASSQVASDGGGTGSAHGNASAAVQPSPNMKRKSTENSQDFEDSTAKDHHVANTTATGTNSVSGTAVGNNNHNSNNSSHLELSFHDHSTLFTCKVYFANEFDVMRAKTLKPPQLDKSLYKELELSKKREELKVSQSRSGPEMELVRKSSTDATNGPTTPPLLTQTPNAAASAKCHQSEGGEEADMDECRAALARSLCSSRQWEARGGKSGSRFCKTLDDRFVLKEMSKGDITFFESFAPNYFDYISKCQQHQQPTLLAKIFGVFKVSIKKKDSFVEKSLLVMENLFYDCDIKNKFDLKGSERNRLVDPTNQNGEIVLLDENLVQMSWSKPLYILSHSKAVLRDAINRDSSFLEKNKVMDYSLLVGLDNENSVLVLGIIDYIRTYTFDKKVESFVKQTGLLGGMGKLPTVISPERYKQRFTDAMDRYFYTVPDRWEGLSKI